VTTQLDLWEVFSEDVPPAIPAEDVSALPILDLEEFELGAACNLGDTECEACQ
jgi:hypothetical protein